MHLCPDQDFIERAYDDAKYGKPSSESGRRVHDAFVLDPTVAPPGKHIMSMFVQYAPYKIEGRDWTNEEKNAFADRCFDIVEQYAPGFKSSVIDRQILTPEDIEDTFGLTGGNIFQGAMNLDKLSCSARFPATPDTRCPLRAFIFAGRQRIPAAASWAPPVGTPPAKFSGVSR